MSNLRWTAGSTTNPTSSPPTGVAASSAKSDTLAGAVVLGINVDKMKSHTKFARKLNLNFSLLSDEDKKVSTAYGAWGEKSMYGRAYVGIYRMTFLID